MMWVRLDCNAPHHPKLLAQGLEAAWLWVASIAYANRQTTNGDIPRHALRALFPWDGCTRATLHRLAASLVAAGLWEENSADSWQIHDYAVYQAEAMSDRVEAKREWDRKRQVVNRAAKKANPNSRVINDLHHLSQRDMGGRVHHSSADAVHPTVHPLSTPVTAVSHGTDPIRSRKAP